VQAGVRVQTLTRATLTPEGSSVPCQKTLRVVTSKNLVVNQERAAAYCGYVLCGVHDRRIEHDIRCASDIASAQPQESASRKTPRGRIKQELPKN
jgi:hypothetical protein